MTRIKQLMMQVAAAPEQLPELCTACFFCLMISAFPLAVPGGYTATSTGKFTLWLILCALYALGLIVAAWLNRSTALRCSAVQRWRECGAAEKLLAALALLTIVSAICSPFGADVLLGMGRYDGLLTKLLLIATALAVAGYGRWRSCYPQLIAAVTVIMCAVAAWQLLGHDPFTLYPEGTLYADGGHRYVGRFLSTIGNVDMLAGYFCLAMPFALYGSIFGRGWRRWLNLLSLAGSALIMYLMDVSGGWVGLAGALVVILPLYAPRGKRRWVVLLLLLVLIVVLAWVYLANHEQDSLIWELSCILHGEVRDEFGSSRVLIWKEAWQSMRGDWLLGSGPGTKRTHFNTVFSRDTGTQMLQSRVSSAHSEYLDLLLEGGLPSLAVYLAALMALAVRCFRRWQQPGVAILSGAVAAYLAQAFFCYSAIVLAPEFWAVLGLLLACSRKCNREEVREGENEQLGL